MVGVRLRSVLFQPRDPGAKAGRSSFKPFVYAESVHEGISPETTYISKHLYIDMARRTLEPARWTTTTSSTAVRSHLLVAMADSDNTVFVQLAMDIGLPEGCLMANKLSADSEIDAYLIDLLRPACRGDALEMASAYSTFANSACTWNRYLVQKQTKDEHGKERF